MTTARPVPLRAGIAPRKLAVSTAAPVTSSPAAVLSSPAPALSPEPVAPRPSAAPQPISSLPKELDDALAVLAENVGSSPSPSAPASLAPAGAPSPSQPASAVARPQTLRPAVEPIIAVPASGRPLPAPPVHSITQPSTPHPPPRMPSRAAIVSGSSFRPAIASAGSLAPVVSPLGASVTMPSPGAFAPAPVPAWIDPVGSTAPAFAVPAEQSPAPVHVAPPPPSAPQAYERAFRRWSQPNFDVPEDIPSTEPLTYQVYTPAGLSSRPRLPASDPSERAAQAKASLAMRLGAAALGVACVVGVAFVALLASGDEPQATATAASQPAEPPPAVDTLPSANVVVAPAPSPALVVVEPASASAPAPVAPPRVAKPKVGKKATSGAAAGVPVLAPNPYDAPVASKKK